MWDGDLKNVDKSIGDTGKGWGDCRVWDRQDIKSIWDNDISNKLNQSVRSLWDTTKTQNTDIWVNHDQWDSRKIGQWYAPCPSSDSDIWSEPDRDVSLQRIGIDVHSPNKLSQRSSPRRPSNRTTTSDVSSTGRSKTPASWNKRRRSVDGAKSSPVCKKCGNSDSQPQDRDNSYSNLDSKSLSEKFRSYEQTIAELENNLQSKKSLIDDLKEERASLVDRIQELKASSEDNQGVSAKASEQQNAKLRESLNNNMNMLGALKEENAKLNASIEKLEQEISELRQREQDLNGELTEEKDANSQLRDVVSDLESRVTVYDDLCQKLKADLKETESRLSGLDSKCASYESDISLHSKSLEQVTSEKEDLMKEVDALNAEKKRLAEKSRQLEDEITESKKLANTLSSENEELRKEQSSLHAEIQASRTELNENRGAFDGLLEENKTLKKSQSAIYNENRTLSSSAERLKALISEQLESNNELQSHLEVLKEKCEHYREKIEAAEELNNQTVEKLTLLRDNAIQNIDKLDNLIAEHFKSKVKDSVDENDSLPSHFDTLDTDKQLVILLDAVDSLNFDMGETIATLSEQVPYLVKSAEVSKEREVDSLRKQLESKSKEFDNLLSHHQRSHKDLQTEKEKLTNRIGELESMEVTSKYSFHSLQILNKEHKDAIAQLQNALQESESLNDELSEKVRFFEQELELKDTEISSNKNHIERLKEIIEKLQTYVSRQKERESSLSDEKLSLQNENGFLKSSLEQLKENSDKKKDEEDRAKQMQSQIDILQNENSRYKKSVEHLQQNYNKNEASVQDLSVQLQSYKDQIRKQEEQIKAFEQDIQNKVQTIKYLTQNSAEEIFSGHKENYQLLLNSKDEEITRLHEQIFNLQTERNKLLSSSTSLSPSKTALVQTEPDDKKYAKKLAALQLQLSMSEERVNSLEKQKNDMRELLIDYSRSPSTADLMRDRAELKEQLEAKTSFINDLKAQLKKEYDSNMDKQKEIMQLTRFRNQATSPGYGEEERKLERPSSLRLKTQLTRDVPGSDRLISAAAAISHKLDRFERLIESLRTDLQHFSEDDTYKDDTPVKSSAKSIMLKMRSELMFYHKYASLLFQLNNRLKSLELFEVPNTSDRESLLSEEIITLSRSGSLSPGSGLEDHPRPQTNQPANAGSANYRQPVTSSQESVFQRSHFSSPDLGIESDANHESSAPEQQERSIAKRSSTKHVVTKSHGGSSGVPQGAMLGLKQFELLRKEIRESLVAIKGVLSRTTFGITHCSKYSSPKKTVEGATFREIRDACQDLDTCLQAAQRLVESSRLAPCLSEEELNMLLQQNQELLERFRSLQEAKRRQELEFESAMERLKVAEAEREAAERKISKKLVQTKKVMRILGHRIQQSEQQEAQSSIPKYPHREDDQTNQ